MRISSQFLCVCTFYTRLSVSPDMRAMCTSTTLQQRQLSSPRIFLCEYFMLCYTLNWLSRSAVFPFCGKQVVRIQQHLVPQPKSECGHDREQGRQEVFREASLLMKIRGLSVRNAETGRQPVELFPAAGRMQRCLAHLSPVMLHGGKMYILTAIRPL